MGYVGRGSRRVAQVPGAVNTTTEAGCPRCSHLGTWETTNLNRRSYLKSYTDSVMGNWSYSYDNLNRLIGGSAASGPYSASPPSSWSYDPFGNRTSGVTPSPARMPVMRCPTTRSLADSFSTMRPVT